MHHNKTLFPGKVRCPPIAGPAPLVYHPSLVVSADSPRSETMSTTSHFLACSDTLSSSVVRDRSPEDESLESPRKQRKVAKERPRKRAVTACNICRARKTKCDNARPSCSFCATTGAQCYYPDNALSLDHTALAQTTFPFKIYY